MLYELNINDKKEVDIINKFISDNTGVEYTQTIEWNIIRTEKIKHILYYKDRNKKILWCCSLFEKKYDDEKIIYAPRGPIIDYNNINIFLDTIYEWCRKKDYKKLIINPIIESNVLSKIDKKFVYSITEKNDYSHLYESCKLAIMPIIFDEEELIKKLPSKFRQNTRRSYRKGLTFKNPSNIDLKNFYNLYIQTSKRHEFNPHDLNYFQKIINTFNDKLVYFEVWKDDKPLAMSIDLIFRDKLIYLYGVSSTENRNMLGMYNLQWETIKYCINNRIKYYDFGGVFCEENDYENKDYGLYKFKQGYCYEGFKDIVPDLIFKIEEEKNDKYCI